MRVRLPSRLSDALAVLGSVLVGAVLLTLCLITAETGLRSTPPAQRLAGVDIVVTGEQTVPQAGDFDVVLPDHVGVPAELVRDVSQLPGVAAAAGDLGFPAAVSDGRGGVVTAGAGGFGWASLLGSVALTGEPPEGPDEVVLAEDAAAASGASVGDPVEVLLRGAPRQMRVAGVADLPGAGVFVSESLAREVSGRSADVVDLVTLRVDRGADRDAVADQVETLVDDHGLVVSTGGDLGRAERPAATAGTGMLLAISLSAGGVVLLLVGFLTAGAVSVAVANRARELALLRAVGATPQQVRSLTARQVSGVALGGALAGVGGGYVVAALAAGPLVSVGMLATGQDVSWSPVPGALTLLLLIGVVQVAARTASWRVSRMPATEAVVETAAEPRSGGAVRTRVGLVVLALFLGSTAVPLVTRSEAALIGASTGTLLAVIGVALVAPAAVSRIARWLAPRTGRTSRWLAVRNSGSYAVRTGGAVAVLALAVGLVLTQVYAGSTVTAAAEHEAAVGVRTDALVTAGAGLPPGALATVGATPSVQAAVPVVSTTAVRTSGQGDLAGGEAHPVLAVGPGVEQVLDLDIVDGSVSELVGDSVAMESGAARFAGVGVGDTVPLTLSDGTAVEPTVVATYGRGFGFGSLVLSLDLLPEGKAGPYDAVLVSGTGPRLAADLADRLGSLPGLQVEGAETVVSGQSGQDPSRWLNLGFSVVLMGYVLVGVANRLVATTLRRRREWQVLRAVGVTPRQLWAMVRTETLLVCAGAVGTGLVISLVPMTMVSLGFVGRPWPQGPAWVIGLTVLVVCLVAYAATLLPTRHLLRSGGPPVPAAST